MIHGLDDGLTARGWHGGFAFRSSFWPLHWIVSSYIVTRRGVGESTMTIGNGSVAQGQTSKLRAVLVDNEYVSKEPAIGIEAQPRDCFLNMLINDRAPKSCNNGRLERCAQIPTCTCSTKFWEGANIQMESKVRYLNRGGGVGRKEGIWLTFHYHLEA